MDELAPRTNINDDDDVITTILTTTTTTTTTITANCCEKQHSESMSAADRRHSESMSAASSRHAEMMSLQQDALAAGHGWHAANPAEWADVGLQFLLLAATIFLAIMAYVSHYRPRTPAHSIPEVVVPVPVAPVPVAPVAVAPDPAPIEVAPSPIALDPIAPDPVAPAPDPAVAPIPSVVPVAPSPGPLAAPPGGSADSSPTQAPGFLPQFRGLATIGDEENLAPVATSRSWTGFASPASAGTMPTNDRGMSLEAYKYSALQGEPQGAVPCGSAEAEAEAVGYNGTEWWDTTAVLKEARPL
ncbi:hypothetical protein QBC44DRAFT_307257 [Cladorrhinum sp. PSN332]|nr:hypothetical protein QBC44DRAFT_307257 [Cladorrhinum sp. PSN332]